MQEIAFELSRAEFMAAATAKVLVEAPGVNRAVIPVSWSLIALLNGGGYSNTQDLRCRYAGDASALLSTAPSIITVTGTSNMLTGIQGAGFANAFTLSGFDPRNKAVTARCLNTITGGSPLDRLLGHMVYFI